MRRVLTSIVEATGMGACTAGAWVQFGPGVGLMVGGVALIVSGVRNA